MWFQEVHSSNHQVFVHLIAGVKFYSGVDRTIL